MSYDRHFKLADDLISHLDTVVSGITDPFIETRYVGFVSIAAVTVYELAIKEIFSEFAEKKNKVFGIFTERYYRRINGRIKLKDLTEIHLPKYGPKYTKRFNTKLEAAEKSILISNGGSIKSSYNDLILWRHRFAHLGETPKNTKYEDVTTAYSLGKEVIKCLAETMVR